MSEIDLKSARVPGSPVLAWSVVLFLLLPLTVVIPVSLTDKTYLSFPEEALSLQHYAKLATSEAWLGSIGQSLVIALGSTAIAVTLGTLCAIGCWRIGGARIELIRFLMLMPVIVPNVVYALGLYRFWVDLRLVDTYLGVIIAHAVTGVPYVVIIVTASLSGFDPRLEQASMSLGASAWQTLRAVILPAIWPGIASGGIFAFIHSWDELVLVLFIASRRIVTLPRRFWDGIQENLDPTMAAAAVCLSIATIGLLALNMRLTRGGK
ncbi:MAG: ABC transporter permease [Pseudomonadota bacterium]|nr:ABC transporter permease [Pseudomonadota bacterium]MEE3098557.1 ABC transporter permease [Pseudomonadota bacterium]